jgi:ADP-heptose:LPS heptosyltransferase
MAGAKHNVGLQKENSYVYDIVVPMPSRKDTHIVDRISRLLAPFNIDAGNETLEIKYTVSEESRAFADDFISSSNIQNKPVIGINISAGGKSRYLGTENYRRLISYIISKYPSVPVVILFKPSDAGRAKNITDGFNRVLLSPMTEKFDQFAAIIERMALIISPDTSVVHLVSAFKIPSVIMYVQSDLNLNIWEPYNVECETLVTDVDDLSTIPVDRIITSFDNMIGYALDRHKERNPGGFV